MDEDRAPRFPTAGPGAVFRTQVLNRNKPAKWIWRGSFFRSAVLPRGQLRGSRGGIVSVGMQSGALLFLHYRNGFLIRKINCLSPIYRLAIKAQMPAADRSVPPARLKRRLARGEDVLGQEFDVIVQGAGVAGPLGGGKRCSARRVAGVQQHFALFFLSQRHATTPPKGSLFQTGQNTHARGPYPGGSRGASAAAGYPGRPLHSGSGGRLPAPEA